MRLRAHVVLLVTVLFALAQMLASATSELRLPARATALTAVTQRLAASGIALADNGEDDNQDSADNQSSGDNEGGGDNANADNGDSGDNQSGGDNANADNHDGGDNTQNDNANNAGDNESDNVEPTVTDESAAPAGPAPPTPTPIPFPNLPPPRPTPEPTATPEPMTEVIGQTTGRDLHLSLNGDRVALQLFSTLPPGITVILRMVDPSVYPETPGALAGDLMFEIEAYDADGAPLASLPAEVNLSVSYDDEDVSDLDEARITIGQLDPATSQWQAAPRLVVDPDGNFVAATITQLGIAAVYAP